LKERERVTVLTGTVSGSWWREERERARERERERERDNSTIGIVNFAIGNTVI
jgi:hypothetical protein